MNSKINLKKAIKLMNLLKAMEYAEAVNIAKDNADCVMVDMGLQQKEAGHKFEKMGIAEINYMVRLSMLQKRLIELEAMLLNMENLISDKDALDLKREIARIKTKVKIISESKGP